MPSLIEKLIRAVSSLLFVEGELPRQEDIRGTVDFLRTRYPEITDTEAEEAIRQIEARHGVTMDTGAVLQEEFRPWLQDARGDMDFYYWNRYRDLISSQISHQVLATMDDVTNRILGLLENPKKEGKWDRRGMVVGHVQSGKTANYIGLICKAADAGYRVIVVIAGIHNKLRDQTQVRIDEGFIGRDSAQLGQQITRVGVGEYNDTRSPSPFTTSAKDFSKDAAGRGFPLEGLIEPAIFVIKKNSSILKNLVDWLKAHNVRNQIQTLPFPMLLIDDEADNASININRGDEDKVSRINGQIRELLNIFDRSCYVGYTATPFANIFIDPDTDDAMYREDLFPRDFIVGLDPPGNYFGADKVFSVEDSNFVRYIDDNEDLIPIRHKITHQVVGLPESLRTSICAFILARAIRLVRNQTTQHNSMLVNISRFTRIQGEIRNEIHSFIDKVGNSIRVNGEQKGEKALRDPEIQRLYDTFQDVYGSIAVSWDDVKKKLWKSISPIDVVEINANSSGSLRYSDFSDGRNVIAVGGFSLSRGLTLEGLTITYFLRNSMAYDTLMQMGRWFGYRDGYEDLCRIWMPETAHGWYEHIAASIEELRADLKRMESLGATPKDFGLKVRSHPDALIVTARSKMGSGKSVTVAVDLANKFIETAVLSWDKNILEANRRAVIVFAESLRKLGFAPENGEKLTKSTDSSGRLLRDVPATVIIEFIKRFQNHPGYVQTASEPVSKYIEQGIIAELKEWDVLFAGRRSGQAKKDGDLIDHSLGFELWCQRRKDGSNSQEGKTLIITEKQRVASRGIERTGLTEEQILFAQERYKDERGLEDSDKKINYPDLIYRAVREKPLLIVHLLAIGEEGNDFRGHDPVVAWSASFPSTERPESRVEYVVNATYYREIQEIYGSSEEDEDEERSMDDAE